MLASNTTAIVIEKVSEAGFDSDEQWAAVEGLRGRIEALSGGEQVTAQQLERRSTHRLYVKRTAADSDMRVIIDDGDYAGLYLVRFVDRPKGGSLQYARIDLEFIESLQDTPVSVAVTYQGEVVTYNDEVVTYA